MKFSSKQVTGMVVAGCAAIVLVPSVAMASGGSLVTITDPSTSAKARVTSAGQLSVTGTTTANLEGRPFAQFGRAGNNANDRVVIAGPTTRTIALSSLTVSATGGEMAVRIRAVQPTDGSCAAGHVVSVVGEDMSFVVPAESSHSVDFPSPLIARPAAGHQICLIAHADTTYVPASSANMTVSGSGFYR